MLDVASGLVRKHRSIDTPALAGRSSQLSFLDSDLQPIVCFHSSLNNDNNMVNMCPPLHFKTEIHTKKYIICSIQQL